MKQVNKFGEWIIKMENEKKYGKLCWYVHDKEKYIEFIDPQEIQVWSKEYYEKWAEKYKKDMQVAKRIVKTAFCTSPIECYCGYSYQGVNQFLRNGIDDEIHTYRELSDVLSMVLCAAPRIPCDLILYRMVNDVFIDMLVKQNRQRTPTPIQEKGFMSTSLLKNIANENEPYAKEMNLLKIYVPRDTIGIYVNAVARRSEEEMLLISGMYLGLASYPYKDEETGKTIYECTLEKSC